MKILLVFLLTSLMTLSYAGEIHLKRMLEKYPWIVGTRLTTTTKGCFICHQPRSDEHNLYGQDYFDTAWNTGVHDFTSIELLDSDGDSYSNIVELSNLTNPGDPKDFPQSK